MKKRLILILFLCLLFIPIVNAATVSKDNVDPRTNIIGKYMFTRETNENYNGVLTTERIMLASKSILSNDESDMIIYYKDPFGTWRNAISGDEVNAPNSFTIDIIDLRNINENAYTATLLAGQEFNAKIKALAANGEATYATVDNNITAIVKASELPEFELTEDNIISSEDSDNLVYAWFIDGTLYYYVKSYTGESEIYVNANASNMFDNLTALTTLDLRNFDFSKVENATNIFSNMTSLSKIFTPKVNTNVDITLSIKMVDEDENVYDKLTSTTENELELNKAFKVTYKYGKDSSDIYLTQYVGKKAIRPENPTKDGWDFGNWYFVDTDNQEKLYNFDTVLTNDVTVFATWDKKIYKITFNTDGGTDIDEQFKYYLGSIDIPENPTKNGHDFIGWHLVNGETVETAIYDLTTPVTANITLKAEWSLATYEIALNNGEATVAGTSAIYEKYNTGWYSDSEATEALTSITIPEKTGYTFGGYYTLENGEGTLAIDNEGNILASNTAYTTNTTLYAKWAPNIYTVTLNNGEANVAGTSVIYEKYNTGWYSDSEATEGLTSITIPEKEGFVFGGYCTETEGAGTLIINNEGNIVANNKSFASNSTLHANWISE